LPACCLLQTAIRYHMGEDVAVDSLMQVTVVFGKLQHITRHDVDLIIFQWIEMMNNEEISL